MNSELLGDSRLTAIEESRLETARRELPDLFDWSARLPDLGSVEAASAFGALCWRQARQAVQSGLLDDRALYWRRLLVRQALVAQAAGPPVIAAFESASRQYHPVFAEDAELKVVVTGFDPFHLDTDIRQSNPSGVLALALDGTRHEVGGKTAQVRTLIVPVRFQDFDEGLIETILTPMLAQLDMIITFSMGRSNFDLERFPGRRRSAETLDNSRRHGGGAPENPLIPAGVQNPEFVEFTLPADELIKTSGDFAVNDNCTVTSAERGEFEAQGLDELSGMTAVSGSGGGYLSNEISYRAISVASSKGYLFPVGHIHTPRYTGYDVALVEAIKNQGTCLVETAISCIG